MKLSNLFSTDHSLLGNKLLEIENIWELFHILNDLIINLGNTLSEAEYIKKGDDIWISRGARVEDSALIKGPAIICDGAEIRHCAFIRGSVLIGKNAVVGNSCEIKNSVLFDNVQVPHYNYVGDSILGYHSHMGAGAVTSNVKGNKSNVFIKYNEEIKDTGLRKFGALIGDYAEIGCGAVLNPGTVIGKNTQIYPLCSVRGTLDDNMIYKSSSTIIKKITS